MSLQTETVLATEEHHHFIATSHFSIPCTNVNHEVMMQYHDWDITITLTLDDTSPFHNNFCSYCILSSAIFFLFLLLQVKVSMCFCLQTQWKVELYTCQTKNKHLWCFAYQVPLTSNIHHPGHLEHIFFLLLEPFWCTSLCILAVTVFQHWLANVFICHVCQNYVARSNLLHYKNM